MPLRHDKQQCRESVAHMYAKALGRGTEIQTNQCRPCPGETGASTTANYCSAETNTVEVNWKRRQSLLLAGIAVVLHVREAEGGEEGGLDRLTQAGLLGLAVQAGHSVIYRGGMQHAAAGANYRVFISLSLSLSDCEPADQNQPTPTLLRCQLQPSDKMQKCTHTHTRTAVWITSMTQVTIHSTKSPHKGLIVCKEHCNRPHYKATGNGLPVLIRLFISLDWNLVLLWGFFSSYWSGHIACSLGWHRSLQSWHVY